MAHGQARSARPRIAVIGGLTRATHDWQRAGEELGVILEHHDGRTNGCRASTIASLVRRADLVITILLPNSHAAVAIVRRTAESYGRACVVVKRLSPGGLAAVMSSGPFPSGMARSAKLASRVRIPEGAANARKESP